MAKVGSLTRPFLGADHPPDASPGWERVLRSFTPAVIGYLTVRLISVGILWIWAAAADESLLGLLAGEHDSVWYLGIADNGYDNGEPAQSNLVFFPLYPMLTSALAAITPFGSMGAGLVIAWLGGIGAACGLSALGTYLYDRRTGIVLAMLWGVLPHAVVESMAYTESLFTAFAVWALYAVLTKHWLAAGSLCLLAGLTRPTATALIAAVCLAALVAVVRRPGDWRPWAAMVVAPVGWIGYLAWVGDRVGRLDGWFYIEKEGWNTGWDGAQYTLGFAFRVLTTPSPHLDFYAVTLILILALALMAHSIVQRQPWPLLLYSAVLLVTTIGGSGMYNAKARFLLVAVPLLLPVATALARTRTAGAVVTLGTLTLISAYFGGYLLLVWEWSP